MSWSYAFDEEWQRDIGYGVPAFCDHPGCGKVIDRGLSYVCGGEPFGGFRGCGLYFCEDHLTLHLKLPALCDRCAPRRRKPFDPTPDHPRWMRHKLTHASWRPWRKANAAAVEKLKQALKKA